MSASPSPRPARTVWHQVHPDLVGRAGGTKIVLVGCGGNGTAMLRALVRLHRAIRALGGDGLSVTLIDGGTVSRANLARQPFTAADVGQNKAHVLANRVNLSYDLRWNAVGTHLTEDQIPGLHSCQVVISCVDTRQARHDILEATARMRNVLYWLDLGNDRTDGQVALGTVGADAAWRVPLPAAHELWPEITDPSLGEDPGPSCSSAEALRRQDLFVHDVLAAHASNLLWRLFRDGRLRHHGAFCNLKSGFARPIPVPSSPHGESELENEVSP